MWTKKRNTAFSTTFQAKTRNHSRDGASDCILPANAVSSSSSLTRVSYVAVCCHATISYLRYYHIPQPPLVRASLPFVLAPRPFPSPCALISISRPDPIARPCRRSPERGKWEYFLPEPSWRFVSACPAPWQILSTHSLCSVLLGNVGNFLCRRFAFWRKVRSARLNPSQDHAWIIAVENRLQVCWPDCSRARK